MKSLCIVLALLFGQMNSQMNSLQDNKPVVHLRPNSNVIDSAFGGKVLQLINAPAELSLPGKVPKVDSLGHPWLIDIKNLGPSAVTVEAKKSGFSIQITPGETVHIYANGTAYSLQ